MYPMKTVAALPGQRAAVGGLDKVVRTGESIDGAWIETQSSSVRFFIGIATRATRMPYKGVDAGKKSRNLLT